jgi:hypothetical protein
VFRRPLAKIDGVLEVKELPVTNKIVVVFDGARVARVRVAEEVRKVARKSGLGDKIVFTPG